MAAKKLRQLEYGYDPDEDPMDTIENRLREIKSMMKPKAELGHFMDDIDPEQRERIMKIASMDVQAIRKMQQLSWKNRNDQLRHGVDLLKLLIRACAGRRKYFKDEKPETALAVKRLKQNSQDIKDVSRSSLGFEMQLALSMEPVFRSKHDIKKIVWVLRATKAFKHLFPSDVENDLAQCVAYERYDSNRLMAHQGREPERLYYVMTGKVQKIQEYRLTSGLVTRSEGFIEKGTTTDPEELEMAWPREHNLVSRGQVEVLIIHRDDFLRLRNRTLGPPIDFLKTLDLFLEFPCDVFRTSHDSIHLKYYAQDVTIVDDTNRTPWLHIVKSGRVRVVRSQNVIDVDSTDKKFLAKTTEELGCGRPFSHASAMLGSLMSQRKMKALCGSQLSLPELKSHLDSIETQNPFFQSLGLESSFQSPPASRRRSTQFSESMLALSNIIKRQKPMIVAKPANDGDKTDEKGDNSWTNPGSKTSKRKAKIVKSPIIAEPGVSNPPSAKGSRMNSETEVPRQEEPSLEDLRPPRKQTRLPPIPATPADSLRPTTVGTDIHPHGTYLTREQTEFDPVYKGRKSKKETKLRNAYLQLDVLNPGDIFGLDSISKKYHYQIGQNQGEGLEHLQPPSASEAKGVTLVSDGAEVIEISKRFFLEHAQNNTMLRVETMQREYMTNDEAKDILYTKETWDQYKNVLMRRMIKKLGQH